jgi:hypothetical protein
MVCEPGRIGGTVFLACFKVQLTCGMSHARGREVHTETETTWKT